MSAHNAHMHPRSFAETAPNRPALIMASGAALSYADLEARANQAAHAFRAMGLRTGDGICVFVHNELSYFEIAWGAQRAGLYFTPVPSRLTAPELRYILEDSGAKALIASSNLASIAREAAAGMDALGLLIAGERGLSSWDQMRAAMPATPIADERAGQPMFYSSGTTGRPKGVRHPLADTPAAAPYPYAAFIKDIFGFGEDTIYLSPAPLYHAAPLSYCMFIQRYGGTAVVMEKFDADAALALIERRRVTHSQWAPTMFIRMLKLPEANRRHYDLSAHRVAIHAAAPCPVPIKRAMIEWWGPILYEYYSGTEGVGVTLINSADALRKPGSVGKPIVGVAHILGENGEELGPNQEGQIYFEGGVAFSYHNAPDKTAAARAPRHPTWTSLGDIGYLDDEGFLFLTDRKDFMIVSGGVNIYPQEIENLLITHPKVADVAVFGVPNEEFGEEVKAVVAPVDWPCDESALAEELLAFCRASLSPIKCPRSIDCEATLPRYDTGKLHKTALRARYWVGKQSRIG